jgi:FkbM family methyltransferase
MSFISYAQNFEDVMLWRALKHIDQGFYIDVGANDPDIDSVTKAFYERGWRGINVEPVPQWFERLEKARPRDLNLQLALGAEPGEITLYEIPDTGLSTAEKKFAERHEAERGYQSRKLSVKMNTLSRVCVTFHLAPIHFLKIDVEGAEKAVLQGTDFGKIRPWIILVEATLPNTQEESYSDWEPLLLNAGYEYAYFDGLNRYYVAGEHENLMAAFKAPPNVFDDFVRSDRLESERRAREAEAKVKEVEQRARQAEAHAQEAETKALQAEERAAQAESKAERAEVKAEQAEVKAEQAEALAQQAQQRASQAEARAREAETKARQAEERTALAEATLHAVFRGRSWRVTQPLRRLGGTARLLREKAKRLLKRLVAPLLVHSIRFAKSRSGLKNVALRWLGNYPRLESRLRRFAAARGLLDVSVNKTSNWSAPAPSVTAPQELMDLSPRAREIYFQLKAALEKNQENK